MIYTKANLCLSAAGCDGSLDSAVAKLEESQKIRRRWATLHRLRTAVVAETFERIATPRRSLSLLIPGYTRKQAGYNSDIAGCSRPISQLRRPPPPPPCWFCTCVPTRGKNTIVCRLRKHHISEAVFRAAEVLCRMGADQVRYRGERLPPATRGCCGLCGSYIYELRPRNNNLVRPVYPFMG